MYHILLLPYYLTNASTVVLSSDLPLLEQFLILLHVRLFPQGQLLELALSHAEYSLEFIFGQVFLTHGQYIVVIVGL